jgi:hypothetical protein
MAGSVQLELHHVDETDNSAGGDELVQRPTRQPEAARPEDDHRHAGRPADRMKS